MIFVFSIHLILYVVNTDFESTVADYFPPLLPLIVIVPFIVYYKFPLKHYIRQSVDYVLTRILKKSFRRDSRDMVFLMNIVSNISFRKRGSNNRGFKSIRDVNSKLTLHVLSIFYKI